MMTFLDIGLKNFTRFSPKQCAYPGCGAWFEPTGSRSHYCDGCLLKAKKERGHRAYMKKRYGAPENWPSEDQRSLANTEALPPCQRCQQPFTRNTAHSIYCPDCAYTISLEKNARRQVERSVPPEYVESILAMQKAKRELTEQIRAQRRALYAAHEAQHEGRKHERGKAS